jgi:hypothetical protein
LEWVDHLSTMYNLDIKGELMRAKQTAIRFTKLDLEAIENIGNKMTEKGMLGLKNSNGTVNMAAVIRFALQEINVQLKKEEEHKE